MFALPSDIFEAFIARLFSCCFVKPSLSWDPFIPTTLTTQALLFKMAYLSFLERIYFNWMIKPLMVSAITYQRTAHDLSPGRAVLISVHSPNDLSEETMSQDHATHAQHVWLETSETWLCELQETYIYTKSDALRL